MKATTVSCLLTIFAIQIVGKDIDCKKNQKVLEKVRDDRTKSTVLQSKEVVVTVSQKVQVFKVPKLPTITVPRKMSQKDVMPPLSTKGLTPQKAVKAGNQKLGEWLANFRERSANVEKRLKEATSILEQHANPDSRLVRRVFQDLIDRQGKRANLVRNKAEADGIDISMCIDTQNENLTLVRQEFVVVVTRCAAELVARARAIVVDINNEIAGAQRVIYEARENIRECRSSTQNDPRNIAKCVVDTLDAARAILQHAPYRLVMLFNSARDLARNIHVYLAECSTTRLEDIRPLVDQIMEDFIACVEEQRQDME